MLIIAALVVVVLSAPMAAAAQQGTRVFRVVELNPIPPEPQPEAQRTFRRALRDLGYVSGQNIRIDDRFAAGSEA
jgi:hypothetical protein